MEKTRVKRMIAALAVMGFLAMPAGVFAGALDMFSGETGVIRVSGGTAHIPVMKEAAKRIMEKNPTIRITIAGGGSGVGISQVGEGLVDIGNSGRKPKDSEIEAHGLVMFKWAMDGVAVVIHPDNPVTALTKTQLKDVFSGTIRSWSELGGPDKPINVFTRDEASGTREVFWGKALDKGTITPSASFVVSNGAMKSAVASNPYAIGYVSVGHIDDSVKALVLDGVTPSNATVKSGDYTVARGLYSNTKGQPGGLSKKFIDYLFSDEGQAIVAENGFIPVR
ncbi:phosphate ABC transporter substrate-binding protein [Desulfatiferula olefinivorans]